MKMDAIVETALTATVVSSTFREDYLSSRQILILDLQIYKTGIEVYQMVRCWLICQSLR